MTSLKATRLDRQLIEQERDLEKILQDSRHGLQSAPVLADLGERAFVDLGLLVPREDRDLEYDNPNGPRVPVPQAREDRVEDPEGVTVEPSINEVETAKKLRADCRNAYDELAVWKRAFESEQYRVLTPKELANLPQPVCEEDDGAALFQKLKNHTRAYRAAEDKHLAMLQLARDANLVDEEAAPILPGDNSYGGNPEVVVLCGKLLVQASVERWLFCDQEEDPASVASETRAAYLSDASARQNSLKSVTLGFSMPDVHNPMKGEPYWTERIGDMRRQVDQLRNMEKGELIPGEAVLMVKRPFEIAENDFHVSNLESEKVDTDCERMRYTRDIPESGNNNALALVGSGSSG